MIIAIQILIYFIVIVNIIEMSYSNNPFTFIRGILESGTLIVISILINEII